MLDSPSNLKRCGDVDIVIVDLGGDKTVEESISMSLK